MVFHAGFKHYSNNLGFFFRKHDGMTACEAAMNKYGKDTAMAYIKKCISLGKGCPILHSVAKHASHLENDIMAYYSTDVDVKDQRGRSLSHTKNRDWQEVLLDVLFFRWTVANAELKEKDPVTGMYPFMLAAMENKCDLNGIYTLLRRKARLSCPRGLDGDASSSSTSSRNRHRKRKRKRDNDGDSVSEVTMTELTVKTEI